MAYWEYIRKSGYELNKIEKQLQRIEKGNITLSFPNAKKYEPNEPRISLVNSIISEMKSDGTTLLFLTDLPQEKS